MRSQIFRYWPLTVVLAALGLSLGVNLGSQPELTGRAGGLALEPVLDQMAAAPLLIERSPSNAISGAIPGRQIRAVEVKWPARGERREINHLIRKIRKIRASGALVFLQATQMSDWVGINPSKRPIGGTFSLALARQVFEVVRQRGVDQIVDGVILEARDENALAFATHVQRARMYRLSRQYFPTLPVLRRYSAFPHNSVEHPLGGPWEEYEFSKGEADWGLVSFPEAPILSEARLAAANGDVLTLRARQPEIRLLLEVSGRSFDGVDYSVDLRSSEAEILRDVGLDGFLVANSERSRPYLKLARP